MQLKKHSSFQRSFGRIKSRKLRDGNVRLMEDVLPQVKWEGTEGQGFIGTFKEIWLEIGFGGGEHLGHRAVENPQIGFIGFEPYINGAVKLLRDIEEKKLKNIRVHNGDVREILGKWENGKTGANNSQFPDFSVSRIFILFPDPWPKKKHNKRRIISHQTIDLLAKVLKKDGQIDVATDDMDYAKWIIRHFLERSDFVWDAKNAEDWKYPPAGHISTKYQTKALKAGRQPVFMQFLHV